ncbi:MAG: acyl-CoA dehydrogenase family protein [Lachnospiraceae bacterium]|nr:acyl-CoA dehydrogenase family protein [Candidatus Darwinimomas equi]
MNAYLEPKHEMVRKLVRQFAETELTKEVIDEIEETHEYPKEIFDKMAKCGFYGMRVPQELGGQGADYRSYVIMAEELARVSVVSNIWATTPNSLAGGPILNEGTDEQKEKYLKPVMNGEMKICFALTEPEAGSDPSGMTTTAVKDGDDYILNGRKCFITMAPIADYAIVFARTNPDPKAREISAFIVDMKLEGVSTGAPEKKMGVIGCPTSDVILNNVRVSKDALLGEEGSGLRNALATLDVGRMACAAQAVGVAEAALEEAIKYSKERKQFGKPLCKHQAIAFMLADMATEVEAMRGLLYQAAWMKDKGSKEVGKFASMAKYYCAEKANEICGKAVQIHGGYGFMKDYKVERFYRDARVMTIYEGTSQVQQMVISRAILK